MTRRGAMVALLLSAVSSGSAYDLYQLGGEGPNPWGAALSFEPGEYRSIGPDGAMQGGGSIASPTLYPTWNDTLVVMVDSTGGQWLRPFFVPDTLNLARDGVRDRVPRGYLDNLASSGPCSNQSSYTDKMRPMYDGDPTTAAFQTASPTEDPGIRYGIFVQNMVVDLGTQYPISRVRFFPRLGQSNPRIEQVLEQMDEPKLRRQDLAEEDFAHNVLPWYEVAGAGSAAGFPESCPSEGSFDQGRWFELTWNGSYQTLGNDPLLTVLGRDEENRETVVDLRFPQRPLQWVAIRPLYPTRNWEIAEFQVFGSGHVGRTVYTSAVLDVSKPVVWGRVRWSGDRDEGARAIIRTRTGLDPDPYRYEVASRVKGEYRDATREEFLRAAPNERRLGEDPESWDHWSAPYPWAAGLRDTTVAAHPWVDGTPILSAGPARYFQLQIVFLSTGERAARMRQLEVQFSRAAAAEVVGEVWPLEVPRGQSTTFTYSVRARFEEESLGYDRLEIFTLTRADTVRSVMVDGVDVVEAFSPRVLDDRIVAAVPKLRGNRDSWKLITVRFDARLVQYGTQFKGWVFDGQGNEVKQLVKPGDADVEFPGNALGVRITSLGRDLLEAAEVGPNPFTPNGDGLNDEVRFRFRLYEVSVPRPLLLTIHDLIGRAVRRMEPILAVRGQFGTERVAPSWDGRDDAGRLVPPGLYLYDLDLDADGGREERTGVVGVAY